MRSFDPQDDDDVKSANQLGAEPWMLALLALNPSYVHWGPHEDYMWVKGDGWNAPMIHASWESFGPMGLDDLNEVVNFYFEIGRDSTRCLTCAGSGYHPDAQWITESFHRHRSPFTCPTQLEEQSRAMMRGFGGEFYDLHGRGSRPDLDTLSRYGDAFREFCREMSAGTGCWGQNITPDEEQALRDAGRNDDGPFGHDAINRSILVARRCDRLGVPLYCTTCCGDGSVYTAPHAHVNIVLWVLHPRKGASRGAEVRINRGDVAAVFAFLREAAKRNADRFGKITS